MKIAFIGFGEAARAFRDSLATADPGIRFFAFDILFSSEGAGGATAEQARDRQVEVCFDPETAVAEADWIISAVTAGSSLEAAQSAVEALGPDQIFIDINSVSPGRKQATNDLLAGRGCAYIDMAVMAPVHPAGHGTPVLVAGALPDAFRTRLDRLGFNYEPVGERPGDATAIKMVRSLFVKGLEAITVQALLAAERSGCYDRILTSLTKSFPGLGWPGFAAYELERVLTHGIRRAAEMRESGETLDELGLGGELARAIAAVHDQLGALQMGGQQGDDVRTAYADAERRLRGSGEPSSTPDEPPLLSSREPFRAANPPKASAQ